MHTLNVSNLLHRFVALTGFFVGQMGVCVSRLHIGGVHSVHPEVSRCWIEP